MSNKATSEPRPLTQMEKTPLPTTLTVIYTDGRQETTENIDARNVTFIMATVKDLFGILITPYIPKEVTDGKTNEPAGEHA